MKKIAAFFAAATLTSAFGATAFAATPDVYVVNFRNEKNTESQSLDRHLNSALTMVGTSVEEVVIDTTTAARWEKVLTKLLTAISCRYSINGLVFQVSPQS